MDHSSDKITDAEGRELCAFLQASLGGGEFDFYFGASYRNIMIWDTIILCFVCLLYGFAGDIFPRNIAYWVVYVNYIFDAIIKSITITPDGIIEFTLMGDLHFSERL